MITPTTWFNINDTGFSKESLKIFKEVSKILGTSNVEFTSSDELEDAGESFFQNFRVTYPSTRHGTLKSGFRSDYSIHEVDGQLWMIVYEQESLTFYRTIKE